MSANRLNASVMLQDIRKAETWARIHRIPFPRIPTVEETKQMELKECYVFSDDKDPRCPTVIVFPVINLDFTKYTKPGEIHCYSNGAIIQMYTLLQKMCTLISSSSPSDPRSLTLGQSQ